MRSGIFVYCKKCQVKLTIVGRGGGKVAYCGEKDKKKA